MYKGSLIFVLGSIAGTIFGVLVGGALGFIGGAVFWEYNDRKDRETGYSRYRHHGPSPTPSPGSVQYQGMSQPKPEPGWQAGDLDEPTPQT